MTATVRKFISVSLLMLYSGNQNQLEKSLGNLQGIQFIWEIQFYTNDKFSKLAEYEKVKNYLTGLIPDSCSYGTTS